MNLKPSDSEGKNEINMSSAHDCELSTYLRIGKGLCTLRLITVESIPNFLIQQFLLDFAEVYNFKAKCLMEFLSFRISVSECIF